MICPLALTIGLTALTCDKRSRASASERLSDCSDPAPCLTPPLVELPDRIISSFGLSVERRWLITAALLSLVEIMIMTSEVSRERIFFARRAWTALLKPWKTPCQRRRLDLEYALPGRNGTEAGVLWAAFELSRETLMVWS